ncbi:hypothetical protein HOK68_00835 [Candidatus Woesearchaeota archaeon]|jgi:hypothetical protein|nr:hypothetical protein [Candidatus Woesearchaeota archaeon]MBT4387290.1 hypothetical protein [Candidatus Woesearchaeota archaeon]MBT4595429.1 hypothetical protein [Candidatus Woesearchaeota archaeon]MBT5741144.1 hypothetical protein [Candidatus Woesearchaeota archaeon]MBT6505306.1 hypothetical protein [Candidatus Woesearchaeota archaeon]
MENELYYLTQLKGLENYLFLRNEIKELITNERDVMKKIGILEDEEASQLNFSLGQNIDRYKLHLFGVNSKLIGKSIKQTREDSEFNICDLAEYLHSQAQSFQTMTLESTKSKLRLFETSPSTYNSILKMRMKKGGGEYQEFVNATNRLADYLTSINNHQLTGAVLYLIHDFQPRFTWPNSEVEPFKLDKKKEDCAFPEELCQKALLDN